MPAFISRLEWVKDKGKGDTQVIDNWKGATIRVASELKNNRITITVSNDYGRAGRRIYNNELGKLLFQIDDKFKLFCRYDSDNTGLDMSENSNDIVFIGDLREIKSKVKDDSIFQLICTDRTFNILNRIGWANYKSSDINAPNGQGWSAPLMVQDAIRQKAGTNRVPVSKREFIYDRKGNLMPSDTTDTEFLLIDARLASEGGFIQDNRSITITKDGTPAARSIGTPDTDTTLFPTVPIATRNHNFPFQKFVAAGKPVYEMLQNMSQLDMTNTPDELDPAETGDVIIQRSMRFYIDEKNRFHWFYPTDTVDTDKFGSSMVMSMGDTSTYEIKGHDLDYVIYDIINFIYFEAGTDMNGDAILGFRYDPTSGTPTIKDSKRSYPRIAESMKKQDEFTAKNPEGHITFDSTKKSGFAYPTSYGSGIRPLWNTTITVTDNATYNDEFKKEARRKANDKANSVISGTSSQRWKGTIETRFYNFTITDLLQFTSVAGGIANEKLRIIDIQHTIQKAGAFTTLTVEQDGKELKA